jgi:putative hydrolase of the HAD superfamily
MEFPESDLEKDYETGKISTREYIQRLHHYFNLENQLNYNYLKEIWKKPFTIIEGSITLLDQVKSQTRIIMLSNTNPLHIDAIRDKYPDLLERFDDLVFSFTAGASKPDPEIYKFALNQAGIKPEQALFTDDLEENIKAAEKVGISSYQFENPQGLAEFLNSNGFSVKI